MCIAAPGQVTAIVDKMAAITYFGVEERKAMIAEVVPSVGDYVLVQMGIILKILSKKEAQESLKAWKEVG